MKAYLAKVAEATLHVDIGELENAVQMIQKVRENGNMVWVVGNGGSAATAEHFANDLLKMAGVRAVAINSLLPSLLAYGNDNGWDRMYADLLGALKKDGDLLVAISCSGNSPNVVEAAKLFHHNCLIVLTGNKYDSDLAYMDANAKIFAKNPDIRAQEDVHLSVCHAIAGALR